MFYVYRFLDKEKNIIYVGKSKQELEQRFKGHTHLPDACYNMVHTIEYIECITESDMSIKEIYYINKFRNDKIYFNLLDTMDAPASIYFDDSWKQYSGPLGDNFPNSINYIKGYATENEIRYNKDGSVDKRKPNSNKGISTAVEGLTPTEVNLIIDQLISKIVSPENINQQQFNFRNLVMFMLAINLPLRPSDFLDIKYGDIFTPNDCPKAFTLQLRRSQKDEIIHIPLWSSTESVLVAYTKTYGYSYKNNAEDSLFQSRKNQVVSPIAWGRILKNAAEAAGIKKNINGESTRKTYGLNILDLAENKYNALLFLGELWGQEREAKILSYLNLVDDKIDYKHYFSEYFSLVNVDLSRISYLQPCVPIVPSNKQISSRKKREQASAGRIPSKRSTDEQTQKTRNKRLWTKEQKLEIVKKYLEQNIPQVKLSKEYEVDPSCIYQWVRSYKSFGESAFNDRRSKYNG